MSDPVLGYAHVEGRDLWIRGWSGRVYHKDLYDPALADSGFRHYLFGLGFLTEPGTLVSINPMNPEMPFVHEIPVEWNGSEWKRRPTGEAVE